MVIVPPSAAYRSFMRPLLASSGTTLSMSPWIATSGTFAFASPSNRSTGLNCFSFSFSSVGLSAYPKTPAAL